MSALTEITLYDLMAHDWDIWIGKGKHGYTVTLKSDHHHGVELKEKCIHPFAIDSFADLCRQFLSDYQRIERKELAAA